MCDTPPVEKRKITCFALPLKCEGLGDSGSCFASSASSVDRNPGSSSDPPARERSTWRREQLSDIEELVQTEQRPGETLPGLGPPERGNIGQTGRAVVGG